MAKHKNEKLDHVPVKELSHVIKRKIAEGGFILIVTTALFIILSLISYNPADSDWSNQMAGKAFNAGGKVGAYIANGLFWLLGYVAYVLPISVGVASWIILHGYRLLKDIKQSFLWMCGLGLLFFFIGSCGLLSLTISPSAFLGHFSPGGVLGKWIANSLSYAVNQQGATLILFSMLLAGMTWSMHLSWGRILEVTGNASIRSVQWSWQNLKQLWIKFSAIEEDSFEEPFEEPLLKPKKERKVSRKNHLLDIETEADPLMEKMNSPEREIAPPVMPKTNQTIEPPKMKAVGGLPALRLLDKAKPGKPMGGFTHQELEALSREVEQHLRDFGVLADVVAVHPGPVITRFELQLAAGVKVSKLSALSLDLARSLSVKSVRVVEIIPGKTVVGIELPNQNRAMVTLSEVLSSEAYQQAHSPLSMALGVDIAGHPMIVDLGKMPHLLVAGTTGSGKSVGINAMILSLLFKATPEHVRMIMIDPKMLELSVYDGIPHLLTPVVTDMKEAASALRWCVGEMERRYRLMSALGVRNLAGFNTKLSEAAAEGQPILDPLWKPSSGLESEAPVLQTLPYIVVIIDELADMMMVVGKKVEQLIARIAQKARAAGIHLILATQRPSVDVLTGLIKSNIPTRMSFQVSSKIDSRTILDQQGAEQLLGHGDMLFLAPGTGAPLRVHGAFVDDKEVHRVADDWRARGQPEYITEITQQTGGDGLDGDDEEEGNTEDTDPLYDQAVEFVIQTRKASISSVQRRFKIGYNRAARLIEEMERTGLVGPLDGGSRDVLTKQ